MWRRSGSFVCQCITDRRFALRLIGLDRVIAAGLGQGTGGARLAKRCDVSFLTASEHAGAAGFRACKRCRPNATDTDVKAAVVTKRYADVANAIGSRNAVRAVAAA